MSTNIHKNILSVYERQGQASDSLSLVGINCIVEKQRKKRKSKFENQKHNLDLFIKLIKRSHAYLLSSAKNVVILLGRQITKLKSSKTYKLSVAPNYLQLTFFKGKCKWTILSHILCKCAEGGKADLGELKLLLF